MYAVQSLHQVIGMVSGRGILGRKATSLMLNNPPYESSLSQVPVEF